MMNCCVWSPKLLTVLRLGRRKEATIKRQAALELWLHRRILKVPGLSMSLTNRDQREQHALNIQDSTGIGTIDELYCVTEDRRTLTTRPGDWARHIEEEEEVLSV